MVAAIAVGYTSNDMGPFMASNPDDSLLLAQTFVGVAGVTMMLLAAITTQRRLADDALAHIAHTLQTSLLPSALPAIPGVETAARFRPAQDGQEVGGDFYDMFETDEGSWDIVVGDVCGKGPEAAALTALARYTLRAVAVREHSPSEILTQLNEALLKQGSEFCTAAYARLELDETAARLTVSAGGHPLPLLLRADGTVETTGRPGLLLGLEPDPNLTDHTLELHRGDALMLYTDGLTDAYAPGSNPRSRRRRAPAVRVRRSIRVRDRRPRPASRARRRHEAAPRRHRARRGPPHTTSRPPAGRAPERNRYVRVRTSPAKSA